MLPRACAGDSFIGVLAEKACWDSMNRPSTQSSGELFTLFCQGHFGQGSARAGGRSGDNALSWQQDPAHPASQQAAR